MSYSIINHVSWYARKILNVASQHQKQISSMVAITIVVSVLLASYLKSRENFIKACDRIHSIHSLQNDFTFSNIFQWTMANKASDNLTQFLTFVSVDTEGVELFDSESIVTSLGNIVKTGPETHRITPPGIWNIGSRLVIKTICDGFGVISYLENEIGVVSDGYVLKCRGSLENGIS